MSELSNATSGTSQTTLDRFLDLLKNQNHIFLLFFFITLSAQKAKRFRFGAVRLQSMISGRRSESNIKVIFSVLLDDNLFP